jgi:uncharacterized protein
LLPEALLRYAERRNEAMALWLTARDEPWIRGLTGALDGLVGRTDQELGEAFMRRILPMCCEMGAPRTAVSGVRHVLDRYYPRQVRAAARPAEVRQTLFEQATLWPSREEAIERAAAMLGIAVDAVMPSLFADRTKARTIGEPSELPSSCEIVQLYNLSLLQGMVQQAEQLRVYTREHVRAVVRYAKLRRLICTCSGHPEGSVIQLSGPLSLFRHTTKYGHALAQFIPSVLATAGWRIEAQCVLRTREDGQACQSPEPPQRRRMLVRSTAGDPIASVHALPRETDSAVERTLIRDVRRLQSEWEMQRETEAVHAGGAVFFPDFTLCKGDRRVLVEIVGYYTPEYIARKIHTLREAGLRNLIVCMDETLACADGEITAPALLRYRKRVDAARLIAMAEMLLADAGREEETYREDGGDGRSEKWVECRTGV